MTREQYQELQEQLDSCQDEIDRIASAQDAAQDFTGCLNELETLPPEIATAWQQITVWLGTRASVTLEELTALRDQEEGLLW